MDRTEAQDWISEVGQQVIERAKSDGFRAPFHCDVYDDFGNGRVCSFEVDHGKLIWFNFNADVVEVAQYPLRLKLESADGGWLVAWVRANGWQLDRANMGQIARIG